MFCLASTPLTAVTDAPQETALRSESQLESTRRSLIELDEDKQAGKEEAESARFLHTFECYAMAPPCHCKYDVCKICCGLS